MRVRAIQRGYVRSVKSALMDHKGVHWWNRP